MYNKSIIGRLAMEKETNNRILSLCALIVGIVALAIGFATYTSVLDIKTTTAKVNSTDTFTSNVNFVPGTQKCVNKDTSIPISGAGNVNDKTWSDIDIELPDDGKIECTAELENNSNYVAYYQGISFDSTINPFSCETEDGNIAADTACNRL